MPCRQGGASWVLLLLEGPYPHLLPSYHVQGTKSLFEHRDHPAPPSCLMPAHQAGDLSSVDPGTSLKVPILGASPYPLRRALGSSRSLGRQGGGIASRTYVRQKEEWPNPWCTTIQAGELRPPELTAGGPWLRAGGWPHSFPSPFPRPRSVRKSQGARSWSHLFSPGQSLPSGLTSFPGPRPHKPSLVYDKKRDILTTTESDHEMKRGSGQEVEERRSGWKKSL